MLKRLVFLFACALASGWHRPAPAQDVHPDLGLETIVSFSTLGMNAGDGAVGDVATDSSGRVWAVNRGRAGAVSLSGSTWQRATFFPLTPGDLTLTSSTQFTSVAFASPAGSSDPEEFFFLGSTGGIAWGRFTSVVEAQAPLVVTASDFPSGTDLTAVNSVNDLASDGGDWLWAATDGGLVLWDLATNTIPTLADTDAYLTGEGAITEVEVAPWGGEVIAIAGDRLFRVDTSGAEVELANLSNGSFSGITFDVASNTLWACTAATGAATPTIVKFVFDATGVLQTPGGVAVGFDPDPVDDLQPQDIAVDGEFNRVFVVAAGSSPVALFQDADGTGNLSGAWTDVEQDSPRPTIGTHAAVHADPNGNVWFGMQGDTDTSDALHGYVVRALSFDQSRYLGEISGTVTLFDLAAAGEAAAPIDLSIGSATADAPFSAPAAGETPGFFEQTFTIVPSDANEVAGSVFNVSSSAEDVEVKATYTFTDANGAERTLTAAASWANILDFEDDFWIGGPCFLDSLGR